MACMLIAMVLALESPGNPTPAITGQEYHHIPRLSHWPLPSWLELLGGSPTNPQIKDTLVVSLITTYF